MSFITACPQCETTFVVRPEHLMAQQGKVRCGQCSHVFNALNNLQEVVAPIADTDQNNSASDMLPLANDAEIGAISPEAISPDAISSEDMANEATADEASAAETVSYEILSAETTAQVPELEVGPDDSVEPVAGTDPQPEAETTHHILRDIAIAGKLKPAKRRRPARLAARIAMWLLCCVLIVLALLQSAYYLRTEIASQWPVLKPYLVQACEQLNCTVDLPKNANLLMVDDSDMQEDAEREGLVQLTSTLINSAPYTQAFPKLEVTLTDANEKPILRRTFMPLEYLPTNTNLNAGILAGDEVHIKLALTTAEQGIAGYRIFITY